MASKLVEKRNELKAKQEKLAAILDESKTGNAEAPYDFTNCKSLEGETSEAKVESFRALSDELADLAADVAREEVSERAETVKSIGDRIKRPTRGPALPDNMQVKSLGQLFSESDAFRDFRQTKSETKGCTFTADELDVKALFETGAGWAPESRRSGRLAELPIRPIQILDLIPSGGIDDPAHVYMEETLRTESAAERAEGAAYAEDAYELVERTSQVRSVGTSLPVTDEQLEDVSQARAYIDNRLNASVRRRLDGQVLNGNGTPPNLRGVLQTVGIQTQAKGADPTFDAVHKAMTKTRVTGRASPNAIVLHPNDWESIRLTRTADGIYIMGNPADSGPMTLFGLPVALSDAIAENTGLVGDFAGHSFLFNRRGIQIEVGYVNAQFGEGKRTIRASLRAAFVVYRPSAFCTVTGI